MRGFKGFDTELKDYKDRLKYFIDNINVQVVDALAEMIKVEEAAGSRIFIIGNGGSSSTADHFAADLRKNTGRNLLATSLTENMALFSAYANDNGYDNVFADILDNTLQAGDLIFAISASGNSENVIRATELAREKNAVVVSFTGFDGGKLKQIAHCGVHVPSNIIEIVEDIHLILCHQIVYALKNKRSD